MSAVEIIAHRGASHDAPENTRASVELAWQQGADAVEVDIHLSQDGEIVAIHDGNTLRTTGVDGEVAALPLAEIQKLDAGLWKGTQFKGEQIPTLDDVLALVTTGKRLFIEVKSGHDKTHAQRIFTPLKTSLHRSNLAGDQIVIISFDYELLQTAKRLWPQIEMLWLLGPEALKRRPKKDLTLHFADLAGLCHNAGLDGLNLSGDWLVEPGIAQYVREARLKLYVHTINDGPFAARLAETHVNGITTDRPAWLREQSGLRRVSQCGRLGGDGRAVSAGLGEQTQPAGQAPE